MSVRHLDTDIACIRCGYNLRTLAINARCPDCGEWVLQSVNKPYLVLCDRVWIRDVAIGAMLLSVILAYFAFHVLYAIFVGRLLDGPSANLDLYEPAALAAVFATGMFFLTSSGHESRPMRKIATCWLLRTVVVVLVVIDVVTSIHGQTYHYHYPDSFVWQYSNALHTIFWLAGTGWAVGMAWLFYHLTRTRETRFLKKAVYLWSGLAFLIFWSGQPWIHRYPEVYNLANFVGDWIYPLGDWIYVVWDWAWVPIALLCSLTILLLCWRYTMAWLRHGQVRVKLK